jgi:hypothetical protein
VRRPSAVWRAFTAAPAPLPAQTSWHRLSSRVNYKKRKNAAAFLQRRFFHGWNRSAAALGAVIAQLEGSTLGAVGLGDVLGAATHLDFVQGAVLVLVIGAAVDRALDAGIGLLVHHVFLLVFRIQREYVPN